MATKKKKKEQSWDEIGEAIGRKIEKEFKGKDFNCGPQWYKWQQYNPDGGGFGRFLFVIGALLALSTMGILPQLPWWNYALIIIGFSAMKF